MWTSWARIWLARFCSLKLGVTLVHLLNKYTKIIRKTRNENDKLENENESLLAKLKSRDELRDQNEIMTTKLKELKLSLKELKDKHDKLESVHDELILDIEH